MSAASNLNVIRKNLNDAIGADFKQYLSNMKLWFRQKLTKEEFDFEVRKFLNAKAVHLHNEFLLEIFNKCQSLCSNQNSKDTVHASNVASKDKQKKSKPKKRGRPVRATFEHRFHTPNLVHYTPHAVAKDPTDDNRPTFCARDFTLPDTSMVHGRMFVTAWDCGLDNVEDDAVRLMVIAVQQQIKCILMALFSRRRAYKLREGKFQHAIGAAPLNPYKRNTYKTSTFCEDSPTAVSCHGEHAPCIRPTVDWGESAAAMEMACDVQFSSPLTSASAYDLLEALQVHRNCLASHTVYAVNIERVIARLWHPSHEELEQEDVHRQEEELRKELAVENYFYS